MEARTVKWRIKKDDIVQVISGKERGKKGKVLLVLQDEGRLKVEKLNMLKRHTKAGRKVQQGGIIEQEGTLHISNVMLICDKCGKGVRTKLKKLENAKRVRVCLKCGEVLDKA